MGEKSKALYFYPSKIKSIFMTVFLLLLLYPSLEEVNALIYVITTFVLFPFARFIVDALLLFDLESVIENKSDFIKNVYQLGRAIIYLILFLGSLIIGSIGLLYFILTVISKRIKKDE